MKICCLIDSLGSGGAQRSRGWCDHLLSRDKHDFRLLTYNQFDHYLSLVQSVGVEPESETVEARLARPVWECSHGYPKASTGPRTPQQHLQESTVIGAGFYIGHFGGIVVSPKAKIGNNCNLSQGVTIGRVNRGPKKGYPTIGNNVYVGPGAKIIGAIDLGNNVTIGANCVVTKDIPDDSVVVGIPGKVISSEGSDGYVSRTDYDQYLQRHDTIND